MKLKKLIALLLALVMVLALAACGNDDKSDDKEDGKPEVTTAPTEPKTLAEQLVGNWSTIVEMTGSMIGMPGFTGKLELKIDYVINEDGTGSAKMDKTAFDASVEKNRQGLVDAMVQKLYEQLGGKDAAEAACKTQFNKTCAEYAQIFPDTLKTTVNIPTSEGEWELEENVLTMGNSTAKISIDGNRMVWTEVTGMESIGLDTLTFNRV